MSVGKNFFDQYSVFCVFGSVVGCVVVPLIAQSMECVIFSALVISLTAATHLNKKANVEHNNKISNYNNAEKKRLKEGVQSASGKRKRDKQHHSLRQQLNPQNEVIVEKQIQQMIKEEEMKTQAMKERTNLKRVKKAKKREERLQRKETKTKEISSFNMESYATNTVKDSDPNISKTVINSKTKYQIGKDKPNKRQCSRPPRFDGGRSPTLGNSFSNAYCFNNNSYSIKNKSMYNCGSGQIATLSPSSSDAMSLSMRSSLSASNSSLSSIGSLTCDSHELTSPQPPPSVWKLPPQLDAEPVWFPGSVHVRGSSNKRVKQSSTSKKERSIKETQLTSALVDGDAVLSDVKPIGFSSLFVMPGAEKLSDESLRYGNYQMDSTREYSLFGPNHIDQVLCQSPSLIIK